MTAQVRFFHYTDASAPQLSNAAGSLKNIIKSCLVGTAGVAYGSKSAIGGWTVAFETGNVVAFRTPAGTQQYYYRLDDSGPGAAGGNEARLHAFRTMSDLVTGTGRFPDTTAGAVIRKSSATVSSNVPWWLIGDDRTFYMWVRWYSPTSTQYADLYCFGEIDSFVPADTYNIHVVARSVENQSSNLILPFSTDPGAAPSYSVRKIARNGFTGSGENVLGARFVSTGSVANPETEAGSQQLDYPGPSGGLVLRPIYWAEGSVAGSQELRGIARGVYHHTYKAATLANGTTITGVSGYSGRTFRVSESCSETGLSRPIFDLTGPW